MKITLINGAPQPGEQDLPYYTSIVAKEIGKNNEITYFPLANMNIKHCTGCWTCWWKTPGQCTLKDDATSVFQSVINSNMVIFASPIMAGFTSSLLKTLQDRLIVLLHPYIELVQGECHHRKRYEQYPDFGLLLSKDADSDAEDIQIITDIYKRLALNFHCTLKHVWINHIPKQKETTHDISYH